MKQRRVAVAVAAVLGIWLISMVFRDRGHTPVHSIGIATATHAKEIPSSYRRSQSTAQAPLNLTAHDETPPRLFVSNKEIHVPSGLRLMIFSPHPDDESLAAGGLIQRVLEKEGEIQVVFITNGEGYMDGVKRELGESKTSSNDFIEYGEHRNGEAIQALSALGLGTERAVFLGFPDGGIDDLWFEHWSKSSPYTSPFTRFDRPPYKNNLNRRLQYSGDNLLDQITRTLMVFTPDWVVLPDPRDNHPDHFASGLFVLDALRRLKEEKEEDFLHTQVFSYLIHFPSYPNSSIWATWVKTAGVGGVGAPCSILSATQWLGLPMSEEELEGKRRALSAHQSQVRMMGGFFNQFLHPYEVFGRLDSQQILLVPQKYAGNSRPNS